MSSASAYFSFDFLHQPVCSHVSTNLFYLAALHIHTSLFYTNHSAISTSIPNTSASSSPKHNTWYLFLHETYLLYFLFSVPVQQPPLLSITSGSSWLYVEWNAQSATFRVLYRESGAPDYQVIVPTTSQLSHNISALQPHTLYNIVVEATHTVTQQKVNSSVTRAYTTPRCEFK